MRIYGVDHVQLAMPAGGEALARRFYGGVLGLAEEPKPAALAGRGGVWFTGGPGLRLHLGVERDFHPARKAHPALLVEGLAELLERCRTADHAVTTGEALEGHARAFVHDPFGNRLELLERL